MRLRFKAKNRIYPTIDMTTVGDGPCICRQYQTGPDGLSKCIEWSPPGCGDANAIEAELTPTIETTVTTPTTIIPLAVNVPTGPRNNWGNDFTKSGTDGFVCANAPYPIGTGIGCYRSINGIYTNTISSSPSFGQTYVLPCIPYFAGGSCFQFENQSTGSPSCNAFCAQS